MLLHRLAIDTPDSDMTHLDKKAARRIFGDLKIWLGYVRSAPLLLLITLSNNAFLTFKSAFMYLGIVTSTYATSFFIPTILRQLGWTSLRAQVMSILSTLQPQS